MADAFLKAQQHFQSFLVTETGCIVKKGMPGSQLPSLHVGAATFLESSNSVSLPAILSLPTGSLSGERPPTPSHISTLT